ncbi:hypothetical protein [Haploplasma axanthum]|uniref:Uncharacterized protein n=1 Tax=Haploplasma axanthum TaxID=29552 RepID=A0A449BBI2_HAPAX|nr:hypothetical protein [Haploplasma axanthum]VEU79791.1 Uncharacterised protein [Haploplasma axanthum]
MNKDIFLGNIKDEKAKDKSPNCFLGAWYHKVFSSRDKWLGIEGTITLPKVTIKRFKEHKNLDTPSIYMGGMAKYESDVGLSFMCGYIIENGERIISPNGIVFRPFWRYITDGETDTGAYDFQNERFYSASNLTPNKSVSNCYAHYSPEFTEFYYLPGDKIRIQVFYPKQDYMQLKITVIEKSKFKESIEMRKINKWKDPIDFESPVFSSPEDNITNQKSFKRVNAIDQSGNEGKPTINTKTKVEDADWESVYLYRNIENKVVKVPFNNQRGSMMNCPDINGFSYTEIDDKTGGSKLSILPERVFE